MVTPTVLVTGAGSSFPYGLPLGSELVSSVADSIQRMSPLPDTPAARRAADPNGRAYLRHDRGELADRIRRSGVSNIDAFIASCDENDRALLIRSMIDVIWRKEDEIAKSVANPPDDWIKWLYNERLLKERETFKHNQVVFLSYNYERLPLIRLATMMSNRFESSVAKSWEAVKDSFTTNSGSLRDRLHHVHGSIGIDPIANVGDRFMNCQYAAEKLPKAAEGVETMADVAGENGVTRVENDRWYGGLWNWAERIVFLGVGYHESNLQKIRITKERIAELRSAGTFVGGTAVNLDDTDRRRVEKFVGRDFVLGGINQDSLSFLKEHLAPDS